MLTFPVLTVMPSLKVSSLKHCTNVCLSICIIHHGLNQNKVVFDAQYKLSYLLNYFIFT